jgi:hypothetical protein
MSLIDPAVQMLFNVDAHCADGWRYIVDARCGDGRRFIVESDELLTAFLELESTLL